MQNIFYSASKKDLAEIFDVKTSYYKTIEVKNKEKHQAIKDCLDSAKEDDNPKISLKGEQNEK